MWSCPWQRSHSVVAERELETKRLKLRLIYSYIGSIDPLNSDRHQISPCNIDAYSTPEVMRIKGDLHGTTLLHATS